MTDGKRRLRNDWSVPLPGRLRGSDVERQAILRRHADALAARRSTYSDPLTGLTAFTAAFLAGRGQCCDSGCRHCPYAPDAPDDG
jgi:hypothetical protein